MVRFGVLVIDGTLLRDGIVPHLPLIAALLFAAALAVTSAVVAARRTRPRRRVERRYVGRPVLVAWNDRGRFRSSDDGYCRDIAVRGAGLNWPFPLKVGARVRLRISDAGLNCTGVVRRCRRNLEHYDVGIEFDRPAFVPRGTWPL